MKFLFILIKNDPNIKEIEIFEYCYLYAGYADGKTFFLKDGISIIYSSEKLKLFYDFLGLKPSTTKCDITGIGVLKEVQAVCGIKYINLRNEVIKNLRHILLIKLENKDENIFYNIISNIQGVLSLCRIRNFTLWRRMVVFKLLAISKIVFLALLIKIPCQVVKELEEIQNSFLLKKFTPKINHETNCKDYKDSSLKNVTISYKIVNLQRSWIKKLYHDCF